MADIQRVFSAIPDAIATKGFWKALLYSFGSWLVTWIIALFAMPEVAIYLGKYGFVIPLLNSIAVFFKQYFDALSTPK
jgi:hypothetical protein